MSLKCDQLEIGFSFTFQKTNNKGADESAQMRRLISAFGVC